MISMTFMLKFVPSGDFYEKIDSKNSFFLRNALIWSV